MKRKKRITRHKRVRALVKGLSSKPRLSIFRSSKHIYAQIIDDESGKTLVSANDIKLKVKTKINRAIKIGKEIAEKALKANIEEVVFDRGGFKYHGRIKALADAAREGGLRF